MKDQSQLVEDDDRKLIDFGDAKQEETKEEEPVQEEQKQEEIRQEEPVAASVPEVDPFMQLHHGLKVKKSNF